MIRNYFIVAWRNMVKHTFHSILNIAGLSIGIAFSLLVAAFVWSELRVNSDLRNLDDQYIIQSNWKVPGMGLDLTTLGPMVKALKDEYPTLVKNYYRWDGVTSNVSKGNLVFREGLQIGDSNFISMYGFTLLYGDPSTALRDPFSVVITEGRALKYFGKKDVLGQLLTIESFSGSKHDFKITGVMKMPVANSLTSLTWDNDNQFYIPEVSAAYFSRSLEHWHYPYIAGFIELQKGVRPADIKIPMQRILERSSTTEIASNMQPFLAPLKNYYLEQNHGLVRKMLYTISLIAFFILLMAIINFVNISVGSSSSRIKEIGVRKVMGSMRQQIIIQFLAESTLLVFFAMLLSLGIYSVANPFIGEVLGKPIPALFDFPFYFIVIPFALVLIIGILAGLYPAFILSAVNTIDSVKGKLQSVNSNIVLRKTLVGFQFFAASIVLIGAIILDRQVSLFFSKGLGYDKEYIVSVQLPRDWTAAGVQRMETYRDEFARLPQVSAASLTWTVPDGQGSGNMLLFAEGKDSTQSVPYESLVADKNYLKTFNIPIKAGRTFQHPADSLSIVINESAVKTMGLNSNAEAIGRRLYLSPGYPMEVIGVIPDFHFGSMKHKIRPLVISDIKMNNIYRLMCFKLKPGNIAGSMAAIQKKWATLMPGSSFEYLFMDESLKRLYKTEIQLKKASTVATALALVIVILGIIGLLSLSIQKRTKEIGIRKVLGATVSNIAGLFLKDFLPVILIASVISIPIAWYIMTKWLSDYSYRVVITVQPFAVSILSLVILTTLLIAIQIYRAVLQNPVKNLRTE